MKKGFKYTLIGLIALAVVGGGAYYAMLPLAASLTEIRPQTAQLSFVEQGIVAARDTVLIYPSTQGEITDIFVSEGDLVNIGDAICKIDGTVATMRIAQIRNVIQSYEAQIENLGIEQESLRRELTATRNSLQGELRAINAQEAGSSEADATQSESTAERVRLQNVLIEHNQNEVERARHDVGMAQTLLEGGLITRNEVEAVEAVLAHAETALEVSQRELAVIESGRHSTSNAAYYEAMRASLNARIDGINRQLQQDNIQSMTAYFNALIAVEEATIRQLEREIDNSIVRATETGFITHLYATGTNMAAPASPLAEITTLGEGVRVEVFVSTQDVYSISIGDTVELTLRQRGQDIVYPGTVVGIGDTAEVRYSALGVEERKVKITIEPDLRGFNETVLGDGFALDVKFILYEAPNKLIIPKTALFKDGGEDKVWVVRGGAAHTVAVQTGMELRTEVVVEGGLNEGDFVVSDANNKDLREGIKIAHP